MSQKEPSPLTHGNKGDRNANKGEKQSSGTEDT